MGGRVLGRARGRDGRKYPPHGIRTVAELPLSALEHLHLVGGDAADRENVQNAVLLAIGVILLLVPVFLVPVEPLLVVAYTVVLVIVALAVAPWVWRFPLGTIDAAPAEATAYLVRRLRMAGHVVHVDREELTVAIGHEAIVKVRIEPFGGYSRIVYRADATLLGWLTVVQLPRIYRRVRAWGRDASTAVIPRGGRLPPPPSAEDAQAILVDAVAETHRLAAEAYAAEREKYQNSQALVVLAAIMVWFLLFLILAGIYEYMYITQRFEIAAGWAFAVTLSVSVPGSWLIRRSRRRRVVRIREWTDRLQEALRLESASYTEARQDGDSLELLLKSQAEVPGWLDAARKAGLSVDPMGWWAVFAMVYLGVDLLVWEAPAFGTLSLPLGVALGVVGVIILLGAGVYYGRWRQRREETLARIRADWDRSYERLRGEMEQYLGRL